MTILCWFGEGSVAEMAAFPGVGAGISGKPWSFAGGYAQSRGRNAVLMCSMFDEPHDPTGGDGADDEEAETIGSEADHHAGFGALGDAEDDRGEEGEENDGPEV
jgi:hypothetical protein